MTFPNSSYFQAPCVFLAPFVGDGCDRLEKGGVVPDQRQEGRLLEGQQYRRLDHGDVGRGEGRFEEGHLTEVAPWLQLIHPHFGVVRHIENAYIEESLQ